MMKTAVQPLSRLLPPFAHLLVVQPFSQTRKFLQTLKYHSYLYAASSSRLHGLHIGSGNNYIKGFCNIDANPYCYCDIVSDVKVLKLRSGSVGVIYSSHIFEHIPAKKVHIVLKEWHRVLKPGGQIYLCVPDLEVLCNLYLNNISSYESEAGRHAVDFAAGVIFGGQTDKYDFHYSGYSFVTLKSLLESIGFRNVRKFSRENVNFELGLDGSATCIQNIPISLNLTADK